MGGTLSPNPGYSLTLRVRLANRPGQLGRLLSAIGRAGGNCGAVDIVSAGTGSVVRDITVDASSVDHESAIVDAARGTDGVEVLQVSDRTFLAHLGGKLDVVPRVPVKTRADLSMVYTPGVARVCEAIHQDQEKAYQLTMKKSMVAVVTDGTAVLGLGNIGPAAALPVMEGKAMLFKEFGGLNAFPLCLDTTDTDAIVATVTALAPGFGGINLEDISAPRCFEIEARLRAALDIPVFHDDQHGTAVVVLAALLNALKVVNKSIETVKIVVVGIGAAGVACTKTLLAAGARQIVGCDQGGILHPDRADLTTAVKQWYAAHTNPRREHGTLAQAMNGADVFLGLSGPGVLTVEDVRRMAPQSIVFAMANPVPEIMPEDAAPHVAVMATGRSDYPNQINNVLCFPGMFRGAMECRAREINEAMKVAAAEAIAGIITPDELHADYIIPSVFDRRIVPAVAAAVREAAQKTGVARRHRSSSDLPFDTADADA